MTPVRTACKIHVHVLHAILSGDTGRLAVLHLFKKSAVMVALFVRRADLTQETVKGGLMPWKKTTGVLSLWVLGQFEAAPAATIILPIRSDPVAELGIPVKTAYFGPVPADRISIGQNAVFFKADAHYRSKLGLSPQRSKGFIGSYDPEHHVLTIIQYNQASPMAEYVNSAWEIQKTHTKGM